MEQLEVNTTNADMKVVKQKLFDDYGIQLSNKALERHIFYFSKCVYSRQDMTLFDASRYIINDVKSFAFFIFGMMAMYTYRQKNLKKF